jgi:transcriptional regulator with XRE-family HTH domain
MTRLVHSISTIDSFREYLNNEEFRTIINSGYFVYIDGFYILNKPKYIVRIEGKPPTLTDYAYSHLTECALTFDETVLYQFTDSAKRGTPSLSMNSGKKISKKYNSESQKEEISVEILAMREEAKKQFEVQQKYTKTCWQFIFEIVTDIEGDDVNQYELIAERFATKTLLDKSYYSRAKKGNAAPPDIRTIIAIAAGYKLNTQLTEEMLRLAGRAFNPTSKEHNAYRFIIETMKDYHMEAKNQLLETEGFKPLGTISRQ